jgi:hypothetical protein
MGARLRIAAASPNSRVARPILAYDGYHRVRCRPAAISDKPCIISYGLPPPKLTSRTPAQVRGSSLAQSLQAYVHNVRNDSPAVRYSTNPSWLPGGP